MLVELSVSPDVSGHLVSCASPPKHVTGRQHEKRPR
jgi:hypothetical protein